MGIFVSLKVGCGRHKGGVLVTIMSDNQFRTLVLLERSLFGLRPQRLLSNNPVFFTDYLIHRRWSNYKTTLLNYRVAESMTERV